MLLAGGYKGVCALRERISPWHACSLNNGSIDVAPQAGLTFAVDGVQVTASATSSSNTYDAMEMSHMGRLLSGYISPVRSTQHSSKRSCKFSS